MIRGLAKHGVFEPSSLRSFVREMGTGLIASTIPLATSVGYATLIFQSAPAGALTIGLWSFVLGVAICSAIIGWSTSMPPVIVGPEPAVVPMMQAMVAAVTTTTVDVAATGGQSMGSVLIALALATALSGTVLLVIGVARLGDMMRFVPSAVIGGFLAATGVLLMIAGLALVLREGNVLRMPARLLDADALAMTVVAICIFVGFLNARRTFKNPLLLPGIVAIVAFVIDSLLLTPATRPLVSSWFVNGLDVLKPWAPVMTLSRAEFDWTALAVAVPHSIGIATVIVVALVVRTAGLEVALDRPANLDQECKSHGLANLVSASTGGAVGVTIPGATKLAADLGSTSRIATLTGAAGFALLLLSGINLPGLIPLPVLAGLMFIVGYGLIADNARRLLRQGDWGDIAIAAGIVLVCLRYGVLVALIGGVVASCILFVVSYSRIGIVRRSATRATFSGNIERTPEAERLLSTHGGAIRAYWLSGYIFFGSSDRLSEEIRGVIGSGDNSVAFVILDVTLVTGIDASVPLSLTKLRAAADRAGAILLVAGASSTVERALAMAGIRRDAGRHRLEADYNTALAWCEDRLLERLEPATDPEEVEAWLEREIGALPGEQPLSAFLERRMHPAGTIVYRQGDPAHTLDLVDRGLLRVSVAHEERAVRVVRYMARRTVFGEMGFFRGGDRTATVAVERDAVLLTLHREQFERMQREEPALAQRLMAFIIRTLSDRLEIANRELNWLL